MAPDNVATLSRLVPRGRSVVAESGVRGAADVERLKALRVSAVLVGESLLKQSDVEAAVRALVTVGAAA
jgi:indole-3-glycerol phosphate synthase